MFENFAKDFLTNINALLFLTALKFEISVFFGMARFFKLFHGSFGIPIYPESLSSKNTRLLLWLISCVAFCFYVQLFINLKSRFLKSFINLVLSVYILQSYPIKWFLSICFELFDFTRRNIISNCTYFLKEI